MAKRHLCFKSHASVCFKFFNYLKSITSFPGLNAGRFLLLILGFPSRRHVYFWSMVNARLDVSGRFLNTVSRESRDIKELLIVYNSYFR